MEPEYFQYKDKNVYDLDSLVQYDQPYFYGCLTRKRDAITKKQIPQEHYFYAKKIKDGWIESDPKYLRSKILITEDWAKANVTKLVDRYSCEEVEAPYIVTKPSTSRILVKKNDQRSTELKVLKEAPALLQLKDHEKFRDNEDNIFEVEVRGIRNEDQIFFKAQDVEKVFGMNSLVRGIHNNDNNYYKGTDYETFLLSSRPMASGSLDNKKVHLIRVQSVFLTYNGLIKVIFNSRSGVAHKFRKWATKIIYTAHLGTDEQRVEQALEIAGVNASLVKQVFDTCVTKVPCVYLFYIGAVSKMRKHYPVDLKDHRTGIIYKFGKTNSLHRRLMEHVKEYGRFECSELKLSQWSPINEKSISQAETQLSHFFNDKKIVFQKHVEIVILGRGDMVGVKGQYLDVYNKYGIVNDMLAISKEKAESALDQLLKEKERTIMHLNREITTLIEREKEWKQKEMEWKQKEMKWEQKEMKWENEREDWKNERETLLEQNTLLLKQLSLQKK
jgi:hypothetical protein